MTFSYTLCAQQIAMSPRVLVFFVVVSLFIHTLYTVQLRDIAAGRSPCISLSFTSSSFFPQTFIHFQSGGLYNGGFPLYNVSHACVWCACATHLRQHHDAVAGACVEWKRRRRRRRACLRSGNRSNCWDVDDSVCGSGWAYVWAFILCKLRTLHISCIYYLI